MSDEIRMTLLHHSTNDLIEELLMWRGLAAEHLDRIAELEAAQRWIPVSERLPEANEMSVSEHANYLLNEYGRLQFDYAAYYKPYGESLRNEARNNLEEYIAELEGKIDQLIEAGELLAEYCDYETGKIAWDALVKDWKECEK